MIKAVIFDMDGLMLDSEVVTFQAYQDVLKDMGQTITKEFYVTLLGRTLPVVREDFKKEYGQDFPFDELIEKVHALLKKRNQQGAIPVKDGLIELLTYLKENNYLTIVASSSSRERLEQLLGYVDVLKYLDDAICGDEVTHGKPHPEIFLGACEKLGVQPDEALVLEDSEAGIQAAHSAHIPVICIPDMKYPSPQYEVMTTKVLGSLHDVIDFLQQQ